MKAVIFAEGLGSGLSDEAPVLYTFIRRVLI